MRTRKKIAVGVGLVVVVLAVAVLMWWRTPPAGPPLRVGMDRVEVNKLFGDNSEQFLPIRASLPSRKYLQPQDSLGNRHYIIVHYDRANRVTKWETESGPSSPPPWLDRAMRWIGW